MSAVKNGQGDLNRSESHSLTAPDLKLKRYLEVDSAIKKLTRELESIKEELKHQGSHSTSNYIVLVEDRERTVPPSLDALIEEFGAEVRALCRVTHYKTIKVKAKG